MTRHAFRRGWAVAAGLCLSVVACSGWDPSRPFEREAPEVREAITHLGDAGDAAVASGILEEYLATGQCKDGNIGTPTRVKERPNGTFDLGLALFQLGERFGRRFGEEEVDSGVGGDPVLKTQRQEQVDCALRIVRAIATDTSQPLDLRARARYLEGNLCFLDGRYEDAVKAYDQSLELAPGMHDSGPIAVADAGRAYNPDLLGRDTAWNRAIALRRIEDKKDAGKDSGSDASPDASNDNDAGNNDKDGGSQGDGGKNDDKPDGGGKDGGKEDAGKDSGQENDDKKDPPKPSPDDKKDAGAPPPPSRQNQDERMLDQLENAPTVQQEDAKKRAQKRRVRGINDK